MPVADKLERFQEIELDELIELRDSLSDVEEFDNRAVKVLVGHHPELGRLNLIIPPIGRCIIVRG